MANVKVSVSKKGMLIGLIVLVLVLGGGGGYLLWRVNQKDTVAPTDSSAGNCRCTDACAAQGRRMYVNGHWECKEDYMGCGRDSNGDVISCCKYTCDPDPVETVTLTYSADENGKVDKPGPHTVEKGKSGPAVTATPNNVTTHEFDKWSDGKTDNPRTDTNVQANITVKATFKAKTAPVETFTLKYTAASEGKITGTATQTVKKGASGTAVTATPNNSTTHKFDKWSDGKTDNPRTDTNVQGNITVTATFKRQDTTPTTGVCKFTYKAGTGGTITPDWRQDVPQEVNHATRGPAVEATPADGYIFDKWSDGETKEKRSDVCTNTKPSTPVTKTFTATFKQSGGPTTRGICKFTYTAGTGGTITPDWRQDVPQEVNHATRGPAVEATPADGYVFVKWEDDRTTAKRSDVCANTNATTPVTVTFKAIFSQVDVSLTCGDGICSEGEDSFNCPQDCGAPPAGKVPDTAIFDDTKDTIIFGIAILLVGMAWTWISTLPKKAYTKISQASSEYITEAKLIRERNTRESRRNRLERRIK